MSTIEKLKVMERLHKLIQRNYCGTAEEYANHLGISRSSLFNYIDELKWIGAEIDYNRSKNCFRYLNTFTFEIIINGEKIVGGCGNKIVQSIFLDCKDVLLYL